MKVFPSFLRLIRSRNLLFIVLTQALFQYFIVEPMFGGYSRRAALSTYHFLLLSLSSILIAAAGYIINDYFDLNIDRINKPSRVIVERVIKRRWAIVWHLVFSFIGVLIGFYVGWRAGVFWLGFANLACVIALWFYSTTFKKKLLSGNVITSLLTAWVVMVVGFATHFRLVTHPEMEGTVHASRLLRFTFLYAAFAFIICLIREVVKDIEDMPGDMRYGCRTMPIVWGVHVAKVFAGTWLVVLAAALAIVFAYVLQLGWLLAATYVLVIILVPVLVIFRRLVRAESTADYRALSKRIKFVMLAGILSMVVLYI